MAYNDLINGIIICFDLAKPCNAIRAVQYNESRAMQ